MTDNPGVADHAAETDESWYVRFFQNAKKAIVAFLVSGAAGGLAPALQNFDFTNLTWSSLWAGLLSGLVGSVLVYVVRNRAAAVGVPPELEAAIESVVNRHFGSFQEGVNTHVTEQLEALKPRLMVRGEDGRLRKPDSGGSAGVGYDPASRAPVVR